MTLTIENVEHKLELPENLGFFLGAWISQADKNHFFEFAQTLNPDITQQEFDTRWEKHDVLNQDFDTAITEFAKLLAEQEDTNE